MLNISEKKTIGKQDFYQVDYVENNDLNVGWHPLKMIIDENSKYINSILDFEIKKNPLLIKNETPAQLTQRKQIYEILDYIKYKQEIYFFVEFTDNFEKCFLSQKELMEENSDMVLNFYENHVIKFHQSDFQKENESLKRKLIDAQSQIKIQKFYNQKLQKKIKIQDQLKQDQKD